MTISFNPFMPKAGVGRIKAEWKKITKDSFQSIYAQSRRWKDKTNDLIWLQNEFQSIYAQSRRWKLTVF